MPSDAPTFGDLLRSHRRQLQVSQERLAERAGVSARAISDLERGVRSHPYRETAILLADALELTGSERSGFLTAARRPAPRSAPGVRRLPATALLRPSTSLIGRDSDLATLSRLLRDERHKLVTVTGPGGVGKTRLTIAAAAALAADYRDGVVFVDLAPLPSATQVMGAIAAALGITQLRSIPLAEAVRRRLEGKHLLVVLDNHEHVLEAAPLLGELLQAAPEVQALVSSRAALRLDGEREYPLAPLRSPDQTGGIPLAELAAWPAVQLFAERAEMARPGFQLTKEHANDVASICRRLDGLPLAIELAAARLRLLSPAMLMERLEQRLPLLTSNRRDVPTRHQSLEMAVAWSYDLLAPQQQALFRSLAVFVDGWTLEGAEFVGERCEITKVLDHMSALSDHSLIVREDGRGAVRYRMLETIHAFARGRLQAMGEERRVREAHLDYLLHLARVNDLEQFDAQFDIRLNRLAAEDANMRDGITWAIAHAPETALALLAGVGFYWFQSDQWVIGRTLLAQALQHSAGEPCDRARVWQHAAWLADVAGDLSGAAALGTEAETLARQLGDDRTIAHVQMIQGDTAMSRGDHAAAMVLFLKAITQFEAMNDGRGLVMCLTELGIAAQDWGNSALALASFTRVGALITAHGLPDRHLVGTLLNIAEVYRQLGQTAEALETCTRALAMVDDTNRLTTATAWLILGSLLLDQGDTAAAASLVGQSLRAFWEAGDRWNLVQALEVASATMQASGQLEAAARTFAAADALRNEMPYPIGVGQVPAIERSLALVRSGLGEEAYNQACIAGGAQALSGAITETQAALMLASMQ